MSRLVVISNRLPLGSNPSGGLVVALHDTMKERGGLWVGVEPGENAGGAQPRFVEHPGLSFERKALEIPEELYDAYYLGYANSVLWPLCHGRIDLLDLQPHYRQGYIEVNRRLARTLAEELAPDDIIWVHDYHLFPLAQMLRSEGVLNPIGFFLHIPFPSAANIGALTDVTELAGWLAAFDLVGLQTNRDVAACLEVFRTLPGSEMLMDGAIRYRSRMVDVKSFPIGIDARQFAEIAASRSQRHEPTGSIGELIIGADRLDYSKGLPQRFRAYADLLEHHSEWRGKVSYLQIASPTRENVEAYRDIREELEQLSGAINGRFADIGYTPLQYIHRPVERDRLAGLFRRSRVGLVTPLADGMNLVAKEYVAAQDPADPGVLVLSCFAGAAEQLGDAVLLANPYDTRQMSQRIHEALAMPLDERRQRHQAAIENIVDEDVNWWAATFIKALQAKSVGSDFLDLLRKLPRSQTLTAVEQA
ncbi:alpha,alpha-trehalose-phosphate synthase (UDP-forming) [Roseibium sp.]|uniref:alpha,alpha-trehalose-phosphate synthase (UDP-forming) n=1 Tax=Roseibium sp. TaxID=1936156 RepID=UPI003A987F9B